MMKENATPKPNILKTKNQDKKLNKEQYALYLEKKSPKTNILKNSFFSFLVGGGICVGAQMLENFLMKLTNNQQLAEKIVPLILISISALLTGLGVYDEIAKYAGAGTLVPITGFSNAIASPAMEFKKEGFVLGVGSKMFVIAGPVIVYGVSSSILIGIVLFIINRYFSIEI